MKSITVAAQSADSFTRLTMLEWPCQAPKSRPSEHMLKLAFDLLEVGFTLLDRQRRGGFCSVQSNLELEKNALKGSQCL